MIAKPPPAMGLRSACNAIGSTQNYLSTFLPPHKLKDPTDAFGELL